MKQVYRKDIDGLRAIAVLAVILNHAKIPGFSGGYVGVDVFLVISGFLITGIIAREIKDGRFSLIKFYERRIRRILPALSVLSVSVLTAGFVLFDMEKLQALAKSLIATTLFFANINFWMESGYFDTPSQLKPLLHTWSLSVEEQFYILFPIILLVSTRHINKYKNLVLISIFAGSLGIAAYQVVQNQITAFYLAQFRIWELITGAILAINIDNSTVSPKIAGGFSLFGIIMLGVPIFFYSEHTAFPGLAALPPVAGTAAVLYGNAKHHGVTRKLLELPILTFIGKISYSLYLWHWPLLVFIKLYLIRPTTLAENFYIIGLIFIISTISWRFVESPFRAQNFLNTKNVYKLAFAAISFLLISSGSIYIFDGFLYTSGLVGTASITSDDRQWSFEECDVNSLDAPEEIPTCRLGNSPQPATVIIWGDSHAPTFGKAIQGSAQENNASGVLTYNNACPPLLDVNVDPQRGDIPCFTYNNMVIQYLKEHPEIKSVILASRLTLYLEGSTYKLEEGQGPRLFDINKSLGNQPIQEVIFSEGLERTLNALHTMGKNIYVITPIPEIGYDVPSANYIAQRTGRDINAIISPSLDEFLERTERTRNILYFAKEKYGIQLIEPWTMLCNTSGCKVSLDDMPLYRDDDHLSIFGSEFLTPIFNPVFNANDNN